MKIKKEQNSSQHQVPSTTKPISFITDTENTIEGQKVPSSTNSSIYSPQYWDSKLKHNLMSVLISLTEEEEKETAGYIFKYQNTISQTSEMGQEQSKSTKD